MKQNEIFLAKEGEAWLKRNRDKLPPKSDPVLEIIERIKPKPKDVLEIGCANGWRLVEIERKYNSYCWGIDPFVEEGQQYIGNRTCIVQGDASRLPYTDARFDLVIYGFCLYLVDREDLFQIVAEGDRVLQDGGNLIIHDFESEDPHKRKYEHSSGLYSYKMEYDKLWLSNPAYALIDHKYLDDGVAVTLLKKNINEAWPCRKL